MKMNKKITKIYRSFLKGRTHVRRNFDIAIIRLFDLSMSKHRTEIIFHSKVKTQDHLQIGSCVHLI